MKKMPTLFLREFGERHQITIKNIVTSGCEWVVEGEGVATQKFDGTCTIVINGSLFKRYDAKAGKPMPANAVKCQEAPDPVTGHWPCWVPVSETDKVDKWFVEAFKRQVADMVDGTYELCGPHFQRNPEKLSEDTFLKHGSVIVDLPDRSFEGIKHFLEEHEIEGLVFHKGDGAMCKIKRSDFNLSWNRK